MAFCNVPSASLPEQATFTTPAQPKEHRDDHNMNRIWNVQHSSHSSSVETASLSSRGSMRLDSVGGSMTASQHTPSSSRASVGSNFEFLPAGTGLMNYSSEGNATNTRNYYLNRGNGQFTRLIPADMLPPLKGVPPREGEHDGMVILEPIEEIYLQNSKDYHQVSAPKPSPLPDNLQKQIDCIVATSPKANKKDKVYCDKWVHEGVCAFTQRGCKYKHEMPHDEATQQSLGLFHGLPVWWKKRLEEQNSLRRGLDAPPQSTSPAHLRATTRHLGNNEAVRGRSHRAVAFEQQHGLPPTAPWYAQQAGFGRASGSQWMQNGIVPFARGRGHAY